MAQQIFFCIASLFDVADKWQDGYNKKFQKFVSGTVIQGQREIFLPEWSLDIFAIPHEMLRKSLAVVLKV